MVAYDTEAAIATLRSGDPTLARVIDVIGPFGLDLRRGLDPFQGLFRAIVYQQLSGRAAGAIYERVVTRLGRGRPPTPRQILGATEQQLRAAGLSRAKVAAVNDLARQTQAGIVPPRRALDEMDDAEIIARLTGIRGVGRWTVEMLLIFSLGRPDVLPAGDLGVRRGFKLAYGRDALPAPAELARHGRRWAPYRSVAAWYLWRASERPPARFTPPAG